MPGRPPATARESEQALLKAELLLEGVRARSESREVRRMRRRRKVRRIVNKLLWVVGSWVAIVIGAFAFSGLVMPLGFWGLLIVPLLMLFATLVVVRLPGSPGPEERPRFEGVAARDLAPRLDQWLDGKRPLLPAPARRELDRILYQLDTLGPELAALPPERPEVAEARRLMADHLPRLIETWEAVPAGVRARDPEASLHLREGLRLVGAELERLNHRLAQERLEALEVEGRFLEKRYAGPPRPEA